MNCRNCGGVMRLADDRRHFECAYCGGRHYPEPPDADGIRVIGSTPDAPSCPVCTRALVAALLDEQAVHFCRECRGVLLPRRTFAAVIDTRRALATDDPVIPRPLDAAALERTLSCPVCGSRFSTYPHYGPGNVVIDNCVSCDLLWLDFGELRQIVAAPGRDRGRAARRVPPAAAVVSEDAVSLPPPDPGPLRILTTLFGRILD